MIIKTTWGDVEFLRLLNNVWDIIWVLLDFHLISIFNYFFKYQVHFFFFSFFLIDIFISLKIDVKMCCKVKRRIMIYYQAWVPNFNSWTWPKVSLFLRDKMGLWIGLYDLNIHHETFCKAKTKHYLFESLIFISNSTWEQKLWHNKLKMGVDGQQNKYSKHQKIIYLFLKKYYIFIYTWNFDLLYLD